jgi:hypothetical protein
MKYRLFLINRKFHYCDSYRTGKVPNYQIFWIIGQYQYCSKVLQVTFCYCPYTSAAELIRGVISFGYLLNPLVHSHQGPLLCFLESS